MTPFVAKGGMLENAWGQIMGQQLCREESCPVPQKAALPVKKQVGQESGMRREKETGSLNKDSPNPSLQPHPSQHTHVPVGQHSVCGTQSKEASTQLSTDSVLTASEQVHYRSPPSLLISLPMRLL